MNELIKRERPPVNFSEHEVDVIKASICKGATHTEFKYFLSVCKLRRLNPLKRQIYWRRNKDGSVAHIVSIDGHRSLAEDSGAYRGQVGPDWCGDDGKWHDVWLGKTPPFAARVGVLRQGFERPIWGVARFDSYAAKTADGRPLANWAKMSDVMIAKCAESLALRKAFPEELSGLYTKEEMEQIATLKDIEEETYDVETGEIVAATETFYSKPTTDEQELTEDGLVDSADQAEQLIRQIDRIGTLPQLREFWKETDLTSLALARPDVERVDAAFKDKAKTFGATPK